MLFLRFLDMRRPFHICSFDLSSCYRHEKSLKVKCPRVLVTFYVYVFDTGCSYATLELNRHTDRRITFAEWLLQRGRKIPSVYFRSRWGRSTYQVPGMLGTVWKCELFRKVPRSNKEKTSEQPEKQMYEITLLGSEASLQSKEHIFFQSSTNIGAIRCRTPERSGIEILFVLIALSINTTV